MYLHGILKPSVIFAFPVGQPPSLLHASYNSCPAARWIAPSTPPPPASSLFAAFTTASQGILVMSLRIIFSGMISSPFSKPSMRQLLSLSDTLSSKSSKTLKSSKSSKCICFSLITRTDSGSLIWQTVRSFLTNFFKRAFFPFSGL